jgi:hypothetical protein
MVGGYLGDPVTARVIGIGAVAGAGRALGLSRRNGSTLTSVCLNEWLYVFSMKGGHPKVL